MEVVIVDGPAEMGALVAAHVVARISAEPDALVGIATGSTPEPVYTALESMETPRETSARVRFAMLDEYIGQPE